MKVKCGNCKLCGTWGFRGYCEDGDDAGRYPNKIWIDRNCKRFVPNEEELVLLVQEINRNLHN